MDMAKKFFILYFVYYYMVSGTSIRLILIYK